MAEHTGLPVPGYNPQNEENVARVSAHKVLEEQCLRACEAAAGAGADPDFCMIATEQLMQAFMWLNRAVFQPGRLSLPEDAELEKELDDDSPPPEGVKEIGPRDTPNGERRWWAWRAKAWVPFCELPEDAQVRAMDSGVTVV